jgi:tripartite ATP-independent transporter DctP family solute receptor
MKKIFVVTAVAVLCTGAVFLSGCSKKSDGAKKAEAAVWKLAFNQSVEHPQAKALQWLSGEFEKETGGAYKIEVVANELLGNQQAALESLRMGTIQMAMVANPLIEAIKSDFAVIALPGLYASLEHQQKTFTSGVLTDLFASTADSGFYALAAFHAGVRNVYGKKPVRSPADMAGMKIRVMQSQLMIDTINAMGGVAVAMSQGEVYNAIQTGVLDGAENSEVTYWDLKQYEVAPVYSYTKHFMIPDILVINKKTFDGLSAEHKKTLERLVRDMIVLEFRFFSDQVEKAKQNAIGQGAQFVDDFDSGIFAQNIKGVVEKNLSSPQRQNLYNAIKSQQP